MNFAKWLSKIHEGNFWHKSDSKVFSWRPRRPNVMITFSRFSFDCCRLLCAPATHNKHQYTGKQIDPDFQQQNNRLHVACYGKVTQNQNLETQMASAWSHVGTSKTAWQKPIACESTHTLFFEKQELVKDTVQICSNIAIAKARWATNAVQTIFANVARSMLGETGRNRYRPLSQNETLTQ